MLHVGTEVVELFPELRAMLSHGPLTMCQAGLDYGRMPRGVHVEYSGWALRLQQGTETRLEGVGCVGGYR